MKNETVIPRGRTLCNLVLIGVSTLLMIGGAARTEAGRNGHRNHSRVHRVQPHHDGHSDGHFDGGHHSRHRADRHHDRHSRPHYARDRARFVVPQRLDGHVRHDYRRHYRGRSYNERHRHYHQVYYFPVYTDHGHYYRPHAYCQGDLYGTGALTLRSPRLSFHIDF